MVTVGITAGRTADSKVSLASAYVHAVERAGGLAVLLPMTEEISVIEAQAACIDALVLSGGGDIDPLLFGEEPRVGLGEVDTARDRWELALCRQTMAEGKPILGICRGMQVMNTAAGGTLMQDIARHKAVRPVLHRQQGAFSEVCHTVLCREDSRLARLFGERFAVNSYHHQAVACAADGFTITAAAADGIAEAIESRCGRWLGVQWHPERMASMRPLWDDFIFDVKNRKN